MSLASLSGVDVVRGVITVPFSGPWHADLLLSQPKDVAGPQTLLFAGKPWLCSYVRVVDFSGRRGVRLVAGLGGWRSTIPARQYGAGVIATATVLSDAALACGEPAPVIDATIQVSVGNAYCRINGPASFVLQDLVGDAWWIDTSGIVHSGTRPATPIVSKFQVLNVDSYGSGIYEIATDAPNDWQPGMTFAGPTASGTVSRLNHVITETQLRIEVMTVS